MTATATVDFIDTDIRSRKAPADMRTPELVSEFAAIKASNFPETAAEARSLTGRLQHARLNAVVAELRARYVLD